MIKLLHEMTIYLGSRRIFYKKDKFEKRRIVKGFDVHIEYHDLIDLIFFFRKFT